MCFKKDQRPEAPIKFPITIDIFHTKITFPSSEHLCKSWYTNLKIYHFKVNPIALQHPPSTKVLWMAKEIYEKFGDSSF